MSMTNQETDTALILENELKRRVIEVLDNVVHKVVRGQIEKAFAEQKSHMLMEISIAVGKMLRVMEEEGRNPLWESKPSDFGLTDKDLNSHMIERNLDHAVHQEPAPVQARVPNATSPKRRATPRRATAGA